MKMFKNISVLAVVAVILLIVGGILHIVALASPYWHFTYEKSLGRIGHYGLWVGCKYILNVVTCSSENINKIPSWLVAVRAMDILGMLFGSGALIMMGLYTFVAKEKWTKIFKISAVVSALVAGVFVLIGACIYGVNISREEDSLTSYEFNVGGLFFRGTYSHDLSWAFGLSIVGAIMCIISGIVIGFSSKRN